MITTEYIMLKFKHWNILLVWAIYLNSCGFNSLSDISKTDLMVFIWNYFQIQLVILDLKIQVNSGWNIQSWIFSQFRLPRLTNQARMKWSDLCSAAVTPTHDTFWIMTIGVSEEVPLELWGYIRHERLGNSVSQFHQREIRIQSVRIWRN